MTNFFLKKAASLAGALFLLTFSLWTPPGAWAASFTVNTLVDENDGVGTGGVSLRDAINAANATAAEADTIVFAVTGTIALTNGELAISNAGAGDELTINGPSAPALTIDAQSNSRVFHITAGGASIQEITILNGSASGGNGAGIFHEGAAPLEVSACAIRGCSARDGSGICIISADSVIARCEVSNNTSTGNSGGILLFNGNHLIINCTISGNVAPSCCAGIENQANLTLESSTIVNNTAGADFGGVGSFFNSLNITNSIIANNTGNNDFGAGLISDLVVDFGGTATSFGFNLVGDGDDSAGALVGPFDIAGSETGAGVVDPMVLPLANNGGPTQTRALQPSSLAFLTGDTTANSDGRGFARPGGGVADGFPGPDSRGAFDPGGALAVELESFEAVAPVRSGRVSVKWTTSAEIDNLGFYVYRAEREGDSRSAHSWKLADEPLNAELIPARGTPSRGADYLFQDSASAGQRAYFLVDIDMSGRETVHGPVFVQVRDASQTQGEVQTLDASEGETAGNSNSGRTSR
jgi:CSLREA domain-containing protein